MRGSENGGRRVFVTGVGVVGPLGIGIAETWDRAIAGSSGAGPVTLFDAEAHACRIACEVTGFEPLDFLDRRAARRMDRVSQLAVAAARLAIAHAGLDLPARSERIGAVIASGSGGNETFEAQHRILIERGPDRLSPLAVVGAIVNMPAGQVSMELGLEGPLSCPVSACASGTHGIGDAAEIIRRGDADAMLAGGSEAGITPFVMAALDATRAMSRRNDAPDLASRPFDRDRDGFVVGEGAAVLVLESAEHLARRSGAPLCELIGYGTTCDAYHLTEPEPSGRAQARAIAAALRRSGRTADEIDYVNAHGTSTPAGDPVEITALRIAFGPRGARVAVSSTKSMHGHCMGAAGAIEAALTAMTISTGTIPPTINVDAIDPDCAGVDHVIGTARHTPVGLAITNSFGFGGHNAVLAMARA